MDETFRVRPDQGEYTEDAQRMPARDRAPFLGSGNA